MSSSELSRENREFVQGLFESESSHWNDVSASLIKWLFATLITINLGGMTFTLTLGIHPEARASAANWFFIAMTAAIVAALSEVFRIWKMKEFFLGIKLGAEGDNQPYDNKEFKKTFRSWCNPALTVALCAFSLFCFSRAGTLLRDATRTCSVEELEIGKQFGDNVVPAKEDLRNCYFYKIDGLPDDPYQRALFEQNLMRKLKETSK